MGEAEAQALTPIAESDDGHGRAESPDVHFRAMGIRANVLPRPAKRRSKAEPGARARGLLPPRVMRRARSLAFHPVVALWEVTRACDLCCLHCRASATPTRDPHELTTAEAFDLVGQLRDLDPDVVVLTGGDPFKRPDLHEIVAEAVRRKLAVAVAPSVTPALTPEAIGRLAALGVGRIALSLDGPDARTHDRFRGAPGSFARTRAAIEAVRAAGVSVQINTSLTRQTAGSLTRTAEVVERIAPALWSVFFVVPVGRARLEQQLDPVTCERVFHFLAAWSEGTGITLKTTAAPAYRRVVLQREAERRREGTRRPLARRPAVNDGKGFLFVSHTGDVYPSGFLPLRAGSVRETPLATIYRTNPLFLALRDEWQLEGKCGICPFRSACGGSRARAYATSGNFLAEDPACIYQPAPA
jgi:radical SAM protein